MLEIILSIKGVRGCIKNGVYPLRFPLSTQALESDATGV